MNFDADEIARATGGRVVVPAGAGPVLTDTRSLVPGAWFLAIVGPRFDGHRFLDRAADAGAVGCIVSEPITDFPGGVVQVPDTVRALQDLGRRARSRLRGPVVGLTGSAGKTTTRALTALACAPLGAVHQTVGNLNNHLGVPMTLLAAPDDAAVTVVEMGTSSPGEIGFLAELATPDVRVVTNVGAAHLQELGGLDGVQREKGALFETARPGDVLCVNLDDPRVRAMPRPQGVRVVTWGTDPAADVVLLGAEIDPDTLHTRARYRTPAGQVALSLPVPGVFLAHNAAAALAVAHALGVDPAASVREMARYAPVGMRMRREPLAGGAVALNDAYNANPTSMKAALDVLSALPGRRVAVLGDMFELGADEDRWHRDVAASAGALGLDLVVLVGERMSRAADACEGAGEVWAAPDADGLSDRLGPWLRAGDHVLFKGSRGARMERILQALQGDPPGDSTD